MPETTFLIVKYFNKKTPSFKVLDRPLIFNWILSYMIIIAASLTKIIQGIITKQCTAQ